MALKSQKRSKVITNRSAKKRRKASASVDLSSALFNFVLPGLLIVGMTAVIGYLSFVAYKGVTASNFFSVSRIEVEGNRRVTTEEVEAVVRKYSSEGGTWSADLDKMREALKSRSEVKSVAVSRQLPDTIRVSVLEREPRAVVRQGEELFWADDEGHIVGLVRKDEPRPRLVMTGWEPVADGGEIPKANLDRVALYVAVTDEWSDFNLVERVSVLDASNLNEVKAVIEEGGEAVEVNLGKVDFGRRLKTAIEAVAGKGGEISAISMKGDQPVVTFKTKTSAQTKGGKNE